MIGTATERRKFKVDMKEVANGDWQVHCHACGHRTVFLSGADARLWRVEHKDQHVLGLAGGG